MKVLYTTNIPSPYAIDFFNLLGKRVDLTVFFERQTAKNRNDSWYKGVNNNFNMLEGQGINIGAESAYCFNLKKLVIKNEYDLIIIGNYSSFTSISLISFLKSKNIRFVICADGGYVKKENKLMYKIKKSLISSADYWLASGNTTKDYFMHYGAGESKVLMYPFTSISKRDIVVIDENRKKELKKELEIKFDKVILFVGQFIFRKGVDVLIRACKMLPKNVGVYIVGDVPTKEYLKLAENNNKDSIVFVGFKSKDELSKYYLISDLFVLPTRKDVWGLVINEAMANGLGVITTNMCVAGLDLIENDVNGYIVKVDDVSGLSNKINSIILNDEKLKEFSRASLEIIKNYTLENMSEIFYNHILTICNGKEIS